VEIVRRSNAAFKRRDREAAFVDYHPNIEIRALGHPPDAPEHLSGIGAAMANLDQWEAAFDDFSSEIEEYIDAGDHVVAVTRWRATGKHTAMNVDQRTFDVFEFSGGKIVRMTLGYSDKAEALKAVGLEE
jgi:ketosteroid isomerase-like protein